VQVVGGNTLAFDKLQVTEETPAKCIVDEKTVLSVQAAIVFSHRVSIHNFLAVYAFATKAEGCADRMRLITRYTNL